jgi:integrase
MASLESENANKELKDIVTLVLNTGMRVGELRDLRWKDVNFQDRVITVGKTMSRFLRRIPYNAVVAEMLEQRESRELKELAQRVLGRSVRFHDLRHTFFTVLMNNGADIATLMSIAGWRSTTTVKIMFPKGSANLVAAYNAAMKKVRG